MKTFRLVLLAGLLVASMSALAAPPSFKGEVFAGGVLMADGSAANIYWVFDDGIFREYIYYHATDELRALASARYFSCQVDGAKGYRVALIKPGAVRALRAGEEVDTLALVQDGASLVLPDGEQRLTRVVAPGQFIPLMQRALSVSLRPKGGLEQHLNYAGCCGHCYAVHDFFGIEHLNYLCCDYSCGGGGGFGGGGATGGW